MSKDRMTDRQSFVRLATKRVNAALKYIRLIGNLANKSNYQYDRHEVDHIFNTLDMAIDECKEKFKEVKPVIVFTLEAKHE